MFCCLSTPGNTNFFKTIIKTHFTAWLPRSIFKKEMKKKKPKPVSFPVTGHIFSITTWKKKERVHFTDPRCFGRRRGSVRGALWGLPAGKGWSGETATGVQGAGGTAGRDRDKHRSAVSRGASVWEHPLRATGRGGERGRS